MATNSKINRFLEGFDKAYPFLKLIIGAIIGLCFFYYTTQNNQTVTAQEIQQIKAEQKNIRDSISDGKAQRDKQLQSIDDKMLKKEVFDVYQKNNIERLDRIEKLQEQILQNLGRQ